MSTLNLSKKIKIYQSGAEGNPRADNCPVRKLWEPKAGEQFVTVKGLVQLPYLDNTVLDEAGIPNVYYDYMPEKYLHVVNDAGPIPEMWPAPSDELADDEELVVAGPGLWNVAKKGGSGLLEQAKMYLRKGLEILEQVKG